MGASVRVEAQALTDPRFGILGELLADGSDLDDRLFRHLGIGVMVQIWSYCTDRNQESLMASEIRHLVGNKRAPEAIIEAGLGEECEEFEGKIRVRGARGRIEWLEKKRKASRKGGDARKAKSKPPPKPLGLPKSGCVSSPTATATATATATKKEEAGQAQLPLPSSNQETSATLLAKAAVTAINSLTGSNYQASSKVALELCEKLAKEKYTCEQVEAVVAAKYQEWGGNPEWQDRVCPSTLLAAKNFRKYIEAIESAPRSFKEPTKKPRRNGQKTGHYQVTGEDEFDEGNIKL